MREPTVSIITALTDRPAPRLAEIHAVLAAREAAFSALAPEFADPSFGLAFGDWV